MSEPANNPYAAPQAELNATDSRGQFNARALRRAWIIVFLANLPLLILMGMQLCDWYGRGAMLLMIVVMLSFSSWFVVANPWFGNRLIDGGVWVAVSQALPILHFALAAVGAFFVEAVGLYSPPPPPPPLPPDYDFINGPSREIFSFIQYSPVAMLTLTAFVGLGLMLSAFLLGLLPILQNRSAGLSED